MVKKLLTLAMGLMLAFSASATINFSASDIQFWVGTGSNSAVVVIAWDDCVPATALAWGVRWNGTTTALGLIDSIQAHDSRFSNGSTATVNGAVYNDGTLFLSSPTNWWCYTVNGQWATVGYTGYTMSNGDIMELSATCDFEMTTAVAATDPNAPTVTEATIAASDILYWVGEGTNEAIMAVNWADTALAWGYRWNGTATVESMMAAIAAADPRFDYSGTGWLDDITFNDGTVSLAGTPGNYWGSTNNGIMDAGMTQTLADGDFEKWADPAAGVIVDSTYDDMYNYWWYTYAYPMTIHPVSVPSAAPVDEATIAFSAIEYWVGEGTNQAVLAVNWADTALAWGYRWNNNATVADMMDDIAAADPRFSYSMNGAYLGDINFTDGGVTLGITPGNYWGSTNNGFMDMGMGQTLANGDLEKWADPAAGVIVDSTYDNTYNYWWYTYAYPMTIHAVTQPLGAGPFDGIVGTPGCAAIPANDPNILGWATACTLELGPQNISIEGSPLVSYHTAEDAIGPCSMTDNLSVVSLGDGGSATLTFEHPIKNGVGPDFAVYENSFDDYFLELAFVEVSSDGQRFVRFPATSLTQTARQLAGSIDATYINNLAGKYRSGYGTPFDLAELADSTGLDINNITHVRIVDVVGSINPLYATYDAFGHMVNDPWPTNSYSAGFDLDGIAVLHSTSEGIDEVGNEMVSVYPNPATDYITVSGAEGKQAEMFDLTGRRVMEFTVSGASCTVSVAALPAGIYMLRIDGEAVKVIK